LLHVPEELVQDDTIVSEETASAMAGGVRKLLEADVGIATTGVAGPEARYGRPPGTVCIAVCSPTGLTARTYRFDGDRPEVIEQAAHAALQLAHAVVCGGDVAESA
jgi:nicotinamide-nucleotide amidase